MIPALQQSLLFLPLCFGVYLSYRIMDVIDLTVEATFVLGAGVFAHFVTLHMNQYLAMLLGIAVASFIGVIVACVQKFAKIDALITSILAIFMLYSVNFMVMGRPNVSLIATPTLIQTLQYAHPMALLAALSLLMLVLGAVYCYFIHSKTGLLLRAYGDNKQLLTQLSKNHFVLLVLGLAVGNGLAGLSGILTAQFNGYADINMSMGVALTAIGSMIIGVTFVNYCRPDNAAYKSYFELLGCVGGVFVYFLAMNVLLYLGVNPIYMKLALGVVLLIFLSSSQMKPRRFSHAR
ncbi:MAG: ABC transporter permease [Gammaproteobacteria bacterium]|nr:ABC transporter permease [Gammaproteobacteria bacterium]MCH9744225.1 ABC transporter permease [Gammaproteobacteria bacterium]